ncbi:MAG: hypothetical protein D6771_01550 [Zetaproteobacteria bacterium]|nr:MAG: hypothetical protein D6771_01550 [Zetaproteobacteria bacterium]
MQRFEAMMDGFAQASLGMPWKRTPQMRELLAMADPDRARRAPGGKLAYMKLGRRRDNNEFVQAKNKRRVLAPYTGMPIERPHSSRRPEKPVKPAPQPPRKTAGEPSASHAPASQQSAAKGPSKTDLEKPKQRSNQLPPREDDGR